MHGQSGRNIEENMSEQTKSRRLRRHTIRKTLLVLDFAAEFFGSIFWFFFLFVSNKLLLNHLAFTFGLFLYGIPIPMAHLMNEPRVRANIVNDGWYEGFLSIFDTQRQTRERARKRVVNAFDGTRKCWHGRDESQGHILNQ